MSNVVALGDRLSDACNAAQAELLPDLPVDVQRLLDADADADAVIPEKKWGKLLRELVDHQQATFRRMGYDETGARRLARASILALAEYGGGQQWYLPKGDDLRVALRDIEIYRRANRNNIEVLAREYRLTTQSVYRIIHEQRRLCTARRQGQLPLEKAPDPVNMA